MSIEFNASISVTELLMKTLENCAKDLAQRCIREASLRHGFDADEEIRILGLENLSIIRKQMIKKSVSKEDKKDKKVPIIKKSNKSSFPMPFIKETVNSDGCQGLAYNRGLFTQCLKERMENGLFCKGCQAEADKNASGCPDCGIVENRLATDLYAFKDPQGRSPISYVKVLNKLKLTTDVAIEEAGKLNIIIPNEHFDIIEKVKTQDTKGRPKKIGSIVEAEDVIDLFAKLTCDDTEYNEVLDELLDNNDNSKKTSKSSKLSDEEKAIKKAQLEEERAAKRAEREAKIAQEKAEKELKLAEEKAEKELKRLAEKAEKEAQLEEERAKKKAEKEAQLEEERAKKKAEKEAQLEEERAKKKAEKEAKLAAEKAEREAKRLAEKEEREAKIAAEKKEKEDKIAAEKAEKEAKRLAEKKEKEDKLAAEKAEKEAKRLAEKESKKSTPVVTKDTKVEQEKKADRPSTPILKEEEEKKAEPTPTPAKVSVTRIQISGKSYLKSTSNVIYDPNTKEEVGIWDPVTKTIKDLPEEDDEEEEESYETDDE